MIKEVLDKIMKKVKKVVIVKPINDCPCTNLIQTNDGVFCKDCGSKK